MILDEVHRLPELFQSLRGIIDQGRRRGKGNGRFLLLGSASLDLMRQSGESLAGRISYLELGPLQPSEIDSKEIETLWVRGGFPLSFLADTEDLSPQWRRNFIRSYLERDMSQFTTRIAAETLRRFWTMLAHNQSQILNAANLARGLGVDGKTVASYLDLLVDLLLGIRDKEELLGHPVVGQTWESFVIESLIEAAPDGTEAHYYRTSHGAELDLVFTLPGGKLWAMEVQRSPAPTLGKGFHSACADLNPAKRFVVYPGNDRFAIDPNTTAIGVVALTHLLRNLKSTKTATSPES